MTAKPPANFQLEGLRGIACLFVALGHSLYLNDLDPSVLLPEWIRALEAAHNGVLVFFLLSGYLIGWTNAGPYTPQNGRVYLWRRFLRLAPIYYVAFLLTAALVVFLQLPAQRRALAATFLGLQNYNAYFGLHLPPPLANGPLWSLNYELLYYLCFLLLWRYRPRLGWVFIPALVAAILTRFAPDIMPLFIGSYACGWLFWAAGWWLARQSEANQDAARAPVLSWLLLVYAGNRINGIGWLFNSLGLPDADAGMIPLENLGMLPVILLLLAAVSRRQLPARALWSALAWFFCLVPVGLGLATGRFSSHPMTIAGGIAAILALALLPFRAQQWLQAFAWLGSISYAFYVVHLPLILMVRHLPLPAGSTPAYFVRLAVWAILALAFAWLLERPFQRWARRQLARLNPSRMSSPSAS